MNKVKNLGYDINNLAKNQVSAVFHLRALFAEVCYHFNRALHGNAMFVPLGVEKTWHKHLPLSFAIEMKN